MIQKNIKFKLNLEKQQIKLLQTKSQHGSLTLTKIDKETGNKNRITNESHHGDATLNGTEYTLYAENDIYNAKGTLKYFSKDDAVATFTFNNYGTASIRIVNTETRAELNIKGNKLTGLPLGNFYAKETRVSEGYTKDENIYHYAFSYKDSTTAEIEIEGTVANTVQKAPVEIIKVTTDTNDTAKVVEGAEFTLILTKYVKHYGSFEEALKHLGEFAEDEYSVFKTRL